jgi:hypothetical protein
MLKYTLGLLALLLTSAASVGAVERVERWAARTGTGTACTRDAPCSVATLASTLMPGHTGTLRCGRYTGPDGMLNPPDNKAGLPNAPITVRAETDGCVTFDGEGARVPVFSPPTATGSWRASTPAVAAAVSCSSPA